jgi:D-glycero-alpha-D-manno-heptose-7-phosphate kinase
MVIRAKAPLRVSFAGGGTDVPPFPETEGGAVLSATIDRYAAET